MVTAQCCATVMEISSEETRQPIHESDAHNYPENWRWPQMLPESFWFGSSSQSKWWALGALVAHLLDAVSYPLNVGHSWPAAIRWASTMRTPNFDVWHYIRARVVRRPKRSRMTLSFIMRSNYDAAIAYDDDRAWGSRKTTQREISKR